MMPPALPAFGLPGPSMPAPPAASASHQAGSRPPGLWGVSHAAAAAQPPGHDALAVAFPRIASEELPNMASAIGGLPHGPRPAFLVNHHCSAVSQVPAPLLLGPTAVLYMTCISNLVP
jgi:hypothetical protein